MPPNLKIYHLHLFLVRLWREQVDQEQFEWRGEIKNTGTGEAHYFRNAAALFDALCSMADAENDQHRNEATMDSHQA